MEFAILIWALQKYVILLYIIKYLIEIFTVFNGQIFSKTAEHAIVVFIQYFTVRLEHVT